MKLTLLGNGNMAQAILRGLINDYDLEIISRNEKKLNEIKLEFPQITVKTLNENNEDIEGKNIIFCVKPYALESISARLTGKANSLFSILAGTKIETLKKNINAKNYIRTMPNMAASYNASMTTITGDRELKNVSIEIFSKIGDTLWVNTENQLDIATAVAGSGPAYLALIAEALADGAVKSGLERAHSMKLVSGLFKSASALLEHNHPALIKDAVTSPGGTTAAGLGALEENNVRNAMIKAVEASYAKAHELGQK
ncbi:MAG: pyrroline-5-carboxylate reductase [Campylobacteraceae bacterium]|nr:pyrroline-5-carboxylate reductase [Campylobacteraceae bacterium]